MKITVLGATGCIGSATAFAIAASHIADELVLIGRRRNLLEHHAMDLSTAVCSLDVNVKAGSYADMADSDLVINAAGLHQDLLADRTEMLIRNVELTREIAQEIRRYCPNAIVINASNPVDALNYAMWRVGGFDRQRLMGYSLNDSMRFRQFVARIKGVRGSEVEAIAIGEHGATQVQLFSAVRINSKPVSFTEEEKAAIRAEYHMFFERFEGLRAGRTSGWTCALGLTELARAVSANSGALLPESVVLQGEYGQTDLSMGVPVKVGRQGVQEILELELAPDEQAALARSIEQLKSIQRIVDETLAR